VSGKKNRPVILAGLRIEYYLPAGGISIGLSADGSGNQTIRRISPAGVVTTVLGQNTLQGLALPSAFPGSLSYPYSIDLGSTSPLTQLWITTDEKMIYAQIPPP